MPSVLVLYNQPLLPRDHPDAESEHSVVEIAGGIARVLAGNGFATSQLALGADPGPLWSELQSRRPDVVFNLYEGQNDNPESETFVAGLLDWSGIAYTGSPPQALALARAKDTVKYLLRGAGLSNAEFLAVTELPLPEWSFGYPAMVKPARLDASVGVHQQSVCTDERQLHERVGHLFATYGGPVLIERYIAGREFHVPLIELPALEALPPLEVHFPARSGDWPILTYERKWDAAGLARTPARLPEADMRRLCDLAARAYRLVGCRDYARVDFRMDQRGEFHILEINPNPEISADSGLASPQMTLEAFIIRLVRQALTRGRRSAEV